MKRCVIVANTKKHPITQIALKFETSRSVRSGFSQKTNSINCGNTNLKTKEIPTEHKINSLMKGHNYFLEYFERYSGIIKTESGLLFK